MMMTMKNWIGFLFLAFVLSGCQEESNDRVIERGSVVDKNGNVYKTVKIGDDWWMAENLRTTVFNDSTPLLFISDSDADSVWATENSPAYTSNNDSLYGLLYNYASVEDSRQLAPEGWHIATEAEWQRLEETIGMSMSAISSLGWRGSNEGEKLAPLYSRGWPEFCELFGSDEFGFKALPGGCRLFNGELNKQNNTAFWWTATSFDGAEAWYRYMDYNQDRVFRQHTYKGYGMSIRCVKNK
jgi:uncharacterized protein (TIGR02145 family)